MSDEQLDKSITEAQRAKDDALAFLKMLIHERDRRIEEKHLADIISGLSDSQKQAMYNQIVGVKTAHSGANAKDGK